MGTALEGFATQAQVLFQAVSNMPSEVQASVQGEVERLQHHMQQMVAM